MNYFESNMAGTPASGVAPPNGLQFPGAPTTATDRRNTAVDYGRHVRRFTSAQECGCNDCSDSYPDCSHNRKQTNDHRLKNRRRSDALRAQ